MFRPRLFLGISIPIPWKLLLAVFGLGSYMVANNWDQVSKAATEAAQEQVAKLSP